MWSESISVLTAFGASIELYPGNIFMYNSCYLRKIRKVWISITKVPEGTLLFGVVKWGCSM